jgi:ABC-type molybdate transport system permease subunit
MRKVALEKMSSCQMTMRHFVGTPLRNLNCQLYFSFISIIFASSLLVFPFSQKKLKNKMNKNRVVIHKTYYEQKLNVGCDPRPWL